MFGIALWTKDPPFSDIGLRYIDVGAEINNDLQHRARLDGDLRIVVSIGSGDNLETPACWD